MTPSVPQKLEVAVPDLQDFPNRNAVTAHLFFIIFIDSESVNENIHMAP